MTRFAGGCSRMALALGLMAGLAAPVAGQTGETDPGLLHATRAQLEVLLRTFEATTGYSEAVREIHEDEADLIRYRLVEGDFEIGDQITLTVPGNTALTASFTVAPGRILLLPDIPEFPVRGLLRSELREALTKHIARYYRDPQVFVTTSIRLRVDGEVGQPGFHVVAADQRFPDMLAGVGQPSRTADMEKIRVKRGKETIWDGEALQTALIEGRTLDQMNLRAGDLIEVPGQSSRDFGAILRSLYYLVPLSVAISRIF